MVDSFTIRNFRGFKDVKVENCRRVNIVVGDNGSGKTALLEALFLVAGVSPELILRTRSWRGFEGGGHMSGSEEELHEELWGDLFYKFDTMQSAFVSLRGKGLETRSVTVTLNRRGQMRVVPPSRSKPGAPVRVVPERDPIEFKWNIGGKPLRVVPSIEGGKLVFPPAPGTHVKAAFFAANRTPSNSETVSRFSALSRSFLEAEFIDKFREHFPSIETLSIEMGSGLAMIFAGVDGLPQKIPLSLASGGMNKLAALLLAITDQAGGIILVDEIENGFYYERLPLIWESILDYARKYDCQLFVSSHSAECLNAAAALAEKNPEEFCMLRTVRENDGTKVRRFDGDRFADAVLSNIEIR